MFLGCSWSNLLLHKDLGRYRLRLGNNNGSRLHYYRHLYDRDRDSWGGRRTTESARQIEQVGHLFSE